MEEWKDIKGFEGYYQVSDHGRVKGLTRKTWNGNGYRTWPELVLKQSIANTGYPTVTLRKGGRSVQVNVHRLVAEAFIPNPFNLEEVNHKHGIKEDNRASELEWCTPSQNIKHAHDFGLNKGSKKPVLQFDMNGMIIGSYPSLTDVARCGYSMGQVSKCCIGKLSSYQNSTWQYFKL